MPASRNYSSTAGLMHLVGGITGAAASLIVDTVTGLPTTPFTLMLDPGVSTEEVVEVTAAGGTTLTVTRGVDGTSAQAHTNGAEVRHAYSARDFQDSRNHEANTTTAHGVTGAVVGTTNTQVLTGKSISGATNTLTLVPKTALPTDTVYTDATGGLTTGTTWRARTPAQANIDKKIVDLLAPAADVTPLTITGIGLQTASAVSVTVPGAPAGVAYDARFVVGARGNVTIKATNDLLAGSDVAALSVQGGNDNGVNRDIQRWVGQDATNTTLAKVDAAGKLTAVGATLTDTMTGTAAAFTGNITATNVPLRARGNVVNATTDAGGSIVVTHGLGVVPVIVLHSVGAGGGGLARVLRTTTRTATTFTVACYYNSSLMVSDPGWYFDWVAEA